MINEFLWAGPTINMQRKGLDGHEDLTSAYNLAKLKAES
jgi:hypothetical protein